MRKFIACLSVSLLLGYACGTADAQDRNQDRYGSNKTRAIRRELPTATNTLFVQNAVRKAELRRSRMEHKKRWNHSPLRPSVSTTFQGLYYDVYLIPSWFTITRPTPWITYHWGY